MSFSDPVIRFPSFSDSRGTLCVADTLERGPFPFPVRRVFWIMGMPTSSSRGEHAHRTCHEALLCVRGACKVALTGLGIKHNLSDNTPSAKFETREFVLDKPDTALHIPPMVWCRIYDFTEDCALLCFASEPFDAQGYIHDIGAFKAARNSQL